MLEASRPACYPSPRMQLPLLDVLTSPVPQGRFDSPIDHRHVLCLHVGAPVPVSYRAERAERRGTRLHGQFCVVPAGSGTRWTLSMPATSLLLRLAPQLLRETADAMPLGANASDLAPAIHIRDAQVERIGWTMQAESSEGYPSGRLFSDSLACALAARLLALQGRRTVTSTAEPTRTLPAWRLQKVVDYVEAHLDQNLSLAELAAVAGFSVSHFRPLFKNATGLSAHRFVMARRVERARALVSRGGLSMTEVALATGFAHSSHMARCLRRVPGTHPTPFERLGGER
jgi:AraC family transcriptional regulator